MNIFHLIAVPAWGWCAWRVIDLLYATEPVLTIALVCACIVTALRALIDGLGLEDS